MKTPTCGNCRHYEPYRDPSTKAIRPTFAGMCKWKPEIDWPVAYKWQGQNPIVFPQTLIFGRTLADKCKQFTPKKP